MSEEDEVASGFVGVEGSTRSVDIITRLYAALDQKMREIETRIERASQVGSQESSAADCERDARTLTTLAKLYEKICEMEEASDTFSSDERISQKALESYADLFRHDIAKRVAFSPLTFSAKGDTRATITQLRRHNAAWDAICEEQQYDRR